VWFTYIIEDVAKTKLYTGATTCLVRRLKQHNGIEAGGAASTTSGRPWRLVYSKRFNTQGEALHHEAKIKGFTRQQKLQFIEAERSCS